MRPHLTPDASLMTAYLPIKTPCRQGIFRTSLTPKFQFAILGTPQAQAPKAPPPPWICLKDYNEGGRSAAQIIWDAAQAYTINPQVLIVTLQKENGLVTDTWPYPWQYRTATGMGCPDGAPCDAQYFGFTNQVNQAARHFRNFYDVNPNWYVPFRTGVNFIRWSPNSACGGSNVNIVTRGTAALYSYTPYQPNAAALNNINGTGDACSAYGNRNFWRDFNNWFGSSLGSPYQVTYAGQSGFPTIAAGQSVPAFFMYRNNGTLAWYDDISIASAPVGTKPIHLSTTNPTNRVSVFGNNWGVNKNRPANNLSAVYESDGVTLATNQHIVQPSQVGKYIFSFDTTTSTPPGTYQEFFKLVAEGLPDMAVNNPGTYLAVTVGSPYQVTYAGQSGFPTIAAGQSVPAFFMYRNNGTLAWYDDISIASAPVGTKPIHLSTTNPTNRVSVFGNNWGVNKNRPANNLSAVYESDGVTLATNQHIVQPSQVGKYIFSFDTTTSTPPGTYQEFFKLVAEGLPDMAVNNPGTYLKVTVVAN